MPGDLHRNLRLIPYHEAFVSAFVWIPVFVLFTRARFDLDGALLLASLYYLFVVALRRVGPTLAGRWLGWVFFSGVLMVTLVHVAFSLMQPWLTEVLERPADDVGSTPLLAGAVYAVTAFVGAGAARGSARFEERVGTVVALVSLGALTRRPR